MRSTMKSLLIKGGKQPFIDVLNKCIDGIGSPNVKHLG